MNYIDNQELYHFHQTPEALAIQLIQTVDLEPNDVVYEPFRGEGAFYNNFPDNVVKHWAEIVDNRDYKEFTDVVDWIITTYIYTRMIGS